MDATEPEAHWLTVHGVLTKRLRRLALLLPALFVLVTLDGFAHRDRLVTAYHLRGALLSELPAHSPYRAHAHQLFQRHSSEPRAEAVRIDLRQIPGLEITIKQYLAGKQPEWRARVSGQEVTFLGYTFVAYFGPTIILVLLLATVFPIRRIHRLLAPRATPDGEVQQKLNSLFYERVTRQYGQGWRGHVLLVSAALFFLSVQTSMNFKTGIHDTKLSPQILVDAAGGMSNVADVEAEFVRDDSLSRSVEPWFIGLPLLACTALAIVAATAVRRDRPPTG
jgi:hypothetical protein